MIISENQSFYHHNNTSYLCRSDFFTKDDTKKPHFPNFITTWHPPAIHEKNFFSSIKMTLQSLINDKRDVYLLYSGGIDSELLLLATLELNLKVIPVIVDLFGINNYELDYAKKFLRKYGIKEYIWTTVSEYDFFETWLPQLIIDTESLSYILSGAYIGARQCPSGAVIIISGENPNVITVKDKKIFFVRHEYSMWPKKIMKKYNYTFLEPYNTSSVIASYLSFPAIKQRLESPVPFSEWTADFESIAKEYFYTDLNFLKLERRFSQHGWEYFSGKTIYNKGMIRGDYQLYSTLQNKKSTLIDQNHFLSVLLFSLSQDKNYSEINKNKPTLSAATFNKNFYIRVGTLIDQQLTFCEENKEVITSNNGQVINY